VIRSAARAATNPSTARRISVISMASATVISRTRAPRLGCNSSRPSLASRVNTLRRTNLIGAVRGVDPTTGHHFDDTRRYVDALALPPGDREKVYALNARRVFPRLTV